MEHQDEKIIRVTGKGTVHIAPDVTRVNILVNSIGRTYPELYQRAQLNLQELGNIVEKHGLSKNLPKTLRFNIERNEERKYDEKGNFIGYEFNGYELKQEIKIDLGMDTKILSSIVQQIGQLLYDAEINIGYTVKEPRPAELRMLEKAVKDATEKAEIMSKAAGCKLGLVKEIDYSEQHIEIYSQVREMKCGEEAMCADASSLDIHPDDLAGTQNVTITWYLSNVK